MQTKLKLLLSITAALLLSNCATTNQQSANPVNNTKPQLLHQQHMDNIANIKQFSLNGRLGIVKQPKGASGRIKWQHLTDENDNIQIFSPFGKKIASIVKTADQVTLTQKNGKSMREKDIETLTEKALGFRLPLTGLKHWALGKPTKNSIVNYMTWDETGSVRTLQQDGWNIEYSDYKKNGRYFLPRKIVLKNKQLKLKLRIDEWSVPQPDTEPALEPAQ